MNPTLKAGNLRLGADANASEAASDWFWKEMWGKRWRRILKNREKVFYAPLSGYPMSLLELTSYLYPANKLAGKNAPYYYACIEHDFLKDTDVQEEKVASFEGFLKNFVR